MSYKNVFEGKRNVIFRMNPMKISWSVIIQGVGLEFAFVYLFSLIVFYVSMRFTIFGIKIQHFEINIFEHLDFSRHFKKCFRKKNIKTCK